MNNLFMWLTFIIIALVIELGTPGLFYFLSFALGATAGAAADYWGYDLFVQSIACLIATVLALVTLHSFVKKSLLAPSTPTNNAALIGQKVVVLELITPDRAGTAKIYGEIWLARAHNTAQIMHPGQTATIVDIQGCHLIVT